MAIPIKGQKFYLLRKKERLRHHQVKKGPWGDDPVHKEKFYTKGLLLPPNERKMESSARRRGTFETLQKVGHRGPSSSVIPTRNGSEKASSRTSAKKNSLIYCFRGGFCIISPISPFEEDGRFVGRNL